MRSAQSEALARTFLECKTDSIHNGKSVPQLKPKNYPAFQATTQILSTLLQRISIRVDALKTRNLAVVRFIFGKDFVDGFSHSRVYVFGEHDFASDALEQRQIAVNLPLGDLAVILAVLRFLDLDEFVVDRAKASLNDGVSF